MAELGELTVTVNTDVATAALVAIRDAAQKALAESKAENSWGKRAELDCPGCGAKLLVEWDAANARLVFLSHKI